MTFEEWCERWPRAAKELQSVGHRVTTITGAHDETDTQSKIRLAAPNHGYVMWRNNNGAAQTNDGRQLRFGLGNDSARLNKHWKSSDLIGIGPNGRFVACEVKRPDWLGPENDRDRAQAAMINQVNALGGIGFFATHVNHYHEMMEKNRG